MIELFDKKNKSDLSYSKNNENPYDFYNKSALNDFTIIRNLLNEWFSEFPDNEKSELKNRMKKDFYPAFYELFLFKLFKNLGFKITVHPKVPNSNKRPDFLIKKGDLEIYIEAKVDKDKSKETEASERKLSEFYDNINKLKTENFFLNINKIEFKNSNQPSTKRLIKLIKKELDLITPEFIENEIIQKGIDGAYTINYEDENFSISITPLPIDKALRNKIIENPIGMYPARGFWGSGEASLRNSIKSKSKKYGKLDKPFIVCINAMSDKSPRGADFESIIWGNTALQLLKEPNLNTYSWSKNNDCIFLENDNDYKLTNLSGILITRVVPYSIINSNYWLFEHPFTSNKLNFEKVGLKYSYLKKDLVHRENGDDFDEIFKINKNWLTDK